MIALLIASIENDSDRDFIENIYTSYRKLMFSEIRRITKNEWATEDVLHAVIVKLIDKIPLLRTFDRAKLVNYIITASKNTALNYIRSNSRHSDMPIDNLTDSFDIADAGLEEKVIYQELMSGFKAAYQKLDPKNRQLLDMKYTLEKNDGEIAVEMGMQPSSVRMALTRARVKLKAIIIETELI